MLFSHPEFLWGLLAVLIPIVVHLFNFRRYRKVYFSNVERLQELQTEQRRHSKVRQWLVLATRVLAIVFLVLAFAQPVIPPSKNTLHSGSTVVSLYIDNSYSMDIASTDGNLIDVARRKAYEVIQAYGVGDRFQVMTNDMKGEEMRWLNRDEAMDALAEVGTSAAAPRMSEVVKRQLDFMRQGGSAAARNRHAYILSDFQQSTADLEALPSDSVAQITLVPLSAAGADNLYIDSLRLDAPAYFVGGSANVDVTVRNEGGRDVEKVPVKLYVGGRERALATVDIPAGGVAKTALRFAFDGEGWTDGQVVIEDYPITFDDSYYFTFRVGDRIRMLEIDGRGRNESLYRLFAADSSVDYRQVTQLQQRLSDYDFVVLNEVERLTSGEVQQLAEWVEEGGSLLVVPPAHGAAGLNALLQRLQAPQLGRWMSRQAKAGNIDFGSSLYRGVFNGKNEEMEIPTVQGYYTTAGTATIKQSILAMDYGEDLLTVTPAGQGRLYLFTTPLTAEQTSFVNQALFVPTLYNMALYSRPLPPVAYTLGSSDPIVLQESYDPSGQPPTLTDGQEISLLPDLRRVGLRQQLVLHGELSHDGIYTLVRAEDGGQSAEHLAFNYPRRESQMTFYTANEIAKAVSDRKDVGLISHSEKPLTDEIRARDGGRKLWRLCVVLALVALATETILLKLRTKQ